MNQLILSEKLSAFLKYLASHAKHKEGKLPSLNELHDKLGISVSTLREELQEARVMGLVEVKPRTGIKCLPYSFTPAVSKSLAYAVNVDRNLFHKFSDLRNHTEASYWYQAVSSLTIEDVEQLQEIIRIAKQKLSADPIQIPHVEHRRLHLTIYCKLDNIFVQGILESYWDIYEAVGLSVYEDQSYLQRVWNYHTQMVDAVANGNFLAGYQALIAHTDLLFQREQNNSKIPFE